MLLGIIGSQVRRNAAGYTPAPVQFNSAKLVLPSCSCTDNNFFSMAGWFKANTSWSNNYPAWMVDPAGGQNSWLTGYFSDARLWAGDGSGHYEGDFWATGVSTGVIDETVWQHFIASIDGRNPNYFKLWVDDVDNSANANYSWSALPVAIDTNGLPIWFGNDNSASFYDGLMADVSLWPGVNFLDPTTHNIEEATRRLFIDASGNPVDPATAVAALGAPAVMLTGGPSGFEANSLGSSGPLTLAAGTLTAATWSPGA